MYNYFKYSIILILFLNIISCSNDEIVKNKSLDRPISHTEMYNCHNKTKWDSLSIAKKLIGKWDWQFIGCFWTPENDNNNQYSRLSIQFNKNNTLYVLEDDSIRQKSKWEITLIDSPNYGIITKPQVENLYGRIFFCDDLLEFNNSYIDGCDNIFKKSK